MFSCRDKWVISLPVAAIIAVRHQTPPVAEESCANNNDTAGLVTFSIYVGQLAWLLEQGKLTVKVDMILEEYIGIDLHQKLLVVEEIN